jgi:hypothetical protein
MNRLPMKTHFAIPLSIFSAIVLVKGALAISYAQNSNSAGNVSGNLTSAGNVTSAGNETALAESNVTVKITPFVQVPGNTVLVEADGLAPNANTTILVDNGVAARSETDENGTLLYALGVPDQITITEIRVDDSTGEERTRNVTHTWEGTVDVVVKDQFDNTGVGELTVIKPVG